MTAISNETIQQTVMSAWSSDILSAEESYGMLTFVVTPSRITQILEWFRSHEELKAGFLTDICGSHYPDMTNQELHVIYHIQSMVNNFRVRLKCCVPVSNPVVPSATALYPGANWMERETYDFYGVVFEGHPNLKRILNVDEMDYYPLRKEYPLEDGTRTDKEDQYFGR